MKIMVALDHTASSEVALDVVLRRAWPAGARIKLANIVLKAELLKAGAATSEDVDVLLKPLRATMLEIAERCAPRLPDCHFEIDVEVGEKIPDALAELAAGWGTNLLVLGVDDRPILERMFLGDITQAVLERVTCPVLIGRKTEAQGNVLVAVDDSECSAGAIEWLMEQSWAKKRNIGLFSVVNELPGSFNQLASIGDASQKLLTLQYEKSMRYHMLRKWSTMLQESLDLKDVAYGVAEGDTAQTVLKAARNWPAEVIVVGSHGRSGISKIVMGSISQRISVQAECSVEVVFGRKSRYYDDVVQHCSELAKVLKENPQRRPITPGVADNHSGYFTPMI